MSAPALKTVAFALAALALGGVAAGCDVVTSVGPQTCDREPEDNPPTSFRGGTTEGGVYMSSEWRGELVRYPGGAQVRFFHGLGAVPRSFTAYVSFDRYGDEGSMSPATGNQAELMDIDEESLTLRNSSCADYFVLVTAVDPQGEVSSGSAGGDGAGGAGGEGGAGD